MIRVRMFVNYICNECVLFDVCGLNYNIEVGKQSVALLSMFCACVCVFVRSLAGIRHTREASSKII